jgi:hypothetical protein
MSPAPSPHSDGLLRLEDPIREQSRVRESSLPRPCSKKKPGKKKPGKKKQCHWFLARKRNPALHKKETDLLSGRTNAEKKATVPAVW